MGSPVSYCGGHTFTHLMKMILTFETELLIMAEAFW